MLISVSFISGALNLHFQPENQLLKGASLVW